MYYRGYRACPLSSPPSSHVPPPLSPELVSPVTSAPRPMWENQLSPLRMGLQSLCLLLATFLATWQVTETQAGFSVIESVKLMIFPGNHVESGTNVELKCEARIISNTGIPLSRQYTFYRDSTVVYTKSTTTLSLLIYPIRQARVANSGTYKCKVEVPDRSMESGPEPLVVTGLQTPMLYLNKSHYTEGEEVTAVCSARKEFGSFYFYFYVGSIEVNKVPASNHLAKAELKFNTAGNKSLHCEYVIDLQPGLVRSNKSSVFQVQVQELSIKASMTIQPKTSVIEGDSVQIMCNVDAPRHKPSKITVHLTKGLEVKSSGESRASYNKTVLTNDSGVYECISVMGNVQKSVNRSVTVSALFSPPLLTMSPREVFENEFFSLTCSSANISTERIHRNELKYYIFKDGQIITLGRFNGEYRNRANTSLNGNYYCVAEAKRIRKTSNGIVFKAKVLVSKPLITVFEAVIVAKPFQIRCHSERGSLPISYTLLNNKVAHRRTVTVRQPYDNAVFTVTITRKEDIRNFTCKAENNHSRESEALNATVIEPVSIPNLIALPDVLEGKQLDLICNIKEGSPPITFKWYRHGLDLPFLTKITKDKFHTYEVKAASSDDSGTYYCEVDNMASKARRSEAATVEVKLAIWKKALIGAFCVLLLVACVVFLCYRYGAKKRGKRENAAELSVKPSSPKSDDSLTVSLAHDTEVFNAHKDAAPHFDGTEGRSANGTRDSVASLPANNSNRSSDTGVDGEGRSVWSERESESGTDDQSSEEAPKEPDVEYTEVVHPQPADSARAPVRKGTDTVYSELQNSQGVAEHPEHAGEQGAVEYAQLNHDLPEPV
ncbi:hypothetical protein AAFF_G00408230 [Aldrovandia affinis]|uniref:Platelet endothelial cell adhesion molecule n=1 Tax=Aldrovandia affinis TaxID=143900 RepID=A0AAD7WK20_9TELE|nr:hypothetical protein AAFF_G00408230 [Aldrovandia affinis]